MIDFILSEFAPFLWGTMKWVSVVGIVLFLSSLIFCWNKHSNSVRYLLGPLLIIASIFSFIIISTHNAERGYQEPTRLTHATNCYFADNQGFYDLTACVDYREFITTQQ